VAVMTPDLVAACHSGRVPVVLLQSFRLESLGRLWAIVRIPRSMQHSDCPAIPLPQTATVSSSMTGGAEDCCPGVMSAPVIDA
jgi:hypothetical protein